ncbi:FHA domain-containing protein [Diaporthe amygdali]|uniref:FHA domain-containing protein n=1 Tax=Phomopsis amygdali TaxID=1214568 RepID=UPI0022FECF3E|nr:FHA domain-containing protein [Diaporthe amygdali]KAJ0118410.1 FHA domain-containing protein [Diaporthe amygdali]
MFTSPAPAALTGSVSLAASSPSISASASTFHPTASTSRTRRGLSYLRNYTHQHLLSRDHNSASSPTNTTESSSRPRPGLTRSTSHTPRTSNTTSTTSTADDLSTASRRFTLVPALSHPLGPSSRSTPEDLEETDDSAAVQSTYVGAPHPGTAITTSAEPEPLSRRSMTRSRSATTGTAMATPANDTAEGGNPGGVLPSIRFSVFVDPRSQRPSLHFSPIARTLPSGSEIIRVGRYSERDSQPAVPANVPSAAPVGFKSKVVSRRHCEFWYEEGKWYIKDVKSSSGTFLNHIRLSPPGQESKPFPVNDGDVVQLGIDFKGGEEMIFRCVKMRLELNRGWQNKLNKFNMNSHKRLWNMTKTEGAGGQNYSQDCSICLNSIAPCQCLFVAPCSHTWHFKCIRSLLSSPHYPIFICPNCRAAADLEAEVEDPEDWEQLEDEVESKDGEDPEGSRSKGPRLDPAPVDVPRQSVDRIRTSLERARATAAERARTSIERSRSRTNVPAAANAPETEAPEAAIANAESAASAEAAMSDGGASTPSTTASSRPGGEGSHATSDPVPINGRRTPSPNSIGAHVTNGHEGPITPRNDAGPWVFDGSGARIGVAPAAGARQSLNGVVDTEMED